MPHRPDLLADTPVGAPGTNANAHAAPTPLASFWPLITAMPASDDNATDLPNCAFPLSSVAVSFVVVCWVDVVPERVNTQAAPTLLLSASPPIRAVFPFDDNATELPNCVFPLSSVAVSFVVVCCIPRRSRAREHPGRPDIAVVGVAADQGSVPIRRQRHRDAELCVPALVSRGELRRRLLWSTSFPSA